MPLTPSREMLLTVAWPGRRVAVKMPVVRITSIAEFTPMAVGGRTVPAMLISDTRVEMMLRSPAETAFGLLSSQIEGELSAARSVDIRFRDGATMPPARCSVAFPEGPVDALFKVAPDETPREAPAQVLFLLNLLGVPSHELVFGEDWERDPEWTHTGDGQDVISFRPKPRIWEAMRYPH